MQTTIRKWSVGSGNYYFLMYFFLSSTCKTNFSFFLSQTHQQLHQLTTVAQAQARIMTWIYSAPWSPIPCPHPHPQLSFLR